MKYHQHGLSWRVWGLGGQYYYGDTAWQFIRNFTGVDLFAVIEQIAREKTNDKL